MNSLGGTTGMDTMAWTRRIATLLACLAFAGAADAQEKLTHGMFEDVAIYRPQGAVNGAVLLLSGDDTDTKTGDKVLDPSQAMARALTQEGALVALIDMRSLRAALEKDEGDCVFPDGDLENLSHYFQGYEKLPTYHTPVLAGVGNGAALAYAMVAQSQAGTFSGALTLGFHPELRLKKALCKGDGKHFDRSKDGSGVTLLPSPALALPWIALQDKPSLAVTKDFARPMATVEVVSVAQGKHDVVPPPDEMTLVRAAYRRIGAHKQSALPPPPVRLGDLPVIEVPPAAAAGIGDGGDRFAVLLSGDGGWAGLDKEVAASLSRRGVPVVGFDTLRYFWDPRTPAGLSADLDRLVRYYASHWKKPNVILIGYSQGADVLPFAINRLPSATRATVARTVLMALGEKASFEFHLGNWIDSDDDDGLPIEPETRTLDGKQTLCLYGEDETESLCPKLPAGRLSVEALPGGHHFDGAYDALAERILGPQPKP